MQVCSDRIAHELSYYEPGPRERVHHKHPGVNMQDRLDLLCSAITNSARENLGSIEGSC